MRSVSSTTTTSSWRSWWPSAVPAAPASDPRRPGGLPRNPREASRLSPVRRLHRPPPGGILVLPPPREIEMAREIRRTGTAYDYLPTAMADLGYFTQGLLIVLLGIGLPVLLIWFFGWWAVLG